MTSKVTDDGQIVQARKKYTFHPIARCRWCNGKFVSVYGVQWICVSMGCRERQHAFAVKRKGKVPRGESPYLYLPTPAQVELHESRTPNLLWGGAAGGSKSHGARWGIYRNCLTIPNYEALILRRTFPELEKTHLRRMAREAALLGAEFIESKRLMRFPTTKAIFEAGHCENDDDVMKYLSSEYDEIDVDESTTVTAEAKRELRTRARSSKPEVLKRGGAFWREFSNPGGVSALETKDLFIDKTPDAEQYPNYRPDDYEFIQARIVDNPYLDPGYVTVLEGLPPDRRRQLLDGDWDVFESQFFPEWRREKDGSPWHVRDCDAEADGTPLMGSIDWGYNQPGCVGWYRLLPDGRVYKQADWKFQGMPIEKVAQGIHERTAAMGLGKFRAFYCDPSMGNKTGFSRSGATEAESHAEVFGRLGLPMIRSDNDRYHGWQRFHDYLREAPDGQPWLVFSPRCNYSIRTIPALMQDKKDPDDCDTTQDDHACVPGDTPIRTERGDVPMAEVTTLDRVWTRRGWKRVLWAGVTGEAHTLIQIQTPDGRTVRTTGNHPVWTGRGFVRADALRYTDICPATYTETPAPNGGGWWGRFRTAITSTIKTAIRAITTSAIWNAWTAPRISANTTPAVRTDGGNQAYRRPAKRPDVGTDRPKDSRGTDHTLDAIAWAMQIRLSGGVSYAAMPLWTSPVTAERSSVQTTASLRSDDGRAWIITRDSAPTAADRSSATNTPEHSAVRGDALKIAAKQLDSPIPVYNLTVEDAPEYLAGGILLHNCDETRYFLAGRPQPGVMTKPSPATQPGTLAWFKAQGRKAADALLVRNY